MTARAPALELLRRSPVHRLRAVLIMRISEACPLVCPLCGGHMRILALITEEVQIRRILAHRCGRPGTGRVRVLRVGKEDVQVATLACACNRTAVKPCASGQGTAFSGA